MTAMYSTLNGFFPRELTWLQLETVNEEPVRDRGSTDSVLRPSLAPAPQRRRPSYIYKIADEESPLLAESDGAGGGSEGSQARIV